MVTLQTYTYFIKDQIFKTVLNKLADKVKHLRLDRNGSEDQ